MKKIGLLIFLVTFLFIGFQLFHFMKPQETKQNSIEAFAPTEQFIMKHLLTDEHLIQTDVKELQTQFLSESLGLWMLYLVEKNDPSMFAHSYESLNKHFINEKGLVSWKVEGSKTFSSNALIDDLRIIESLYKAGQKWDVPKYMDTANNISKSIRTYNFSQNMWRDYYDMHTAANQLTLSYLSPEAFFQMKYEGIIHEDLLNQTKQFLQVIPVKDVFYPKTYQIDTNTFFFDETINLIDQLYTAYHLEQWQINTDSFFHWLKNEFYEKRLLYGRYHLTTKKPSSTYESPSVYALAILYSLQRGDQPFTLDLYDRMTRLQVKNPDSPYYGGYIDFNENNTHAFDNLLPLYAERKLIHENIIQ